MATSYNGFFTVSDDFNIFYREWTPTSNAEKAVLCIHGFGGHSGRFETIGQSLSIQGVASYAVDLRGFGNSKECSLPRGDVKSFQRHLEDLPEIIGILKAKGEFQKVFILGHSLGGLYALWYGAQYSQSIDGLIMLSPPIDSKPKMSDEDRSKIPFLLANAPQTMIMTRNGNLPVETESNPKNRAMLELNTQSFSVRYLFGISSDIMRDNPFSNAKKFTKPTLILQGEADTEALPSGAKRLYDSINSADKDLILIPGADHSLNGAIDNYCLGTNDPKKTQQTIDSLVRWINGH